MNVAVFLGEGNVRRVRGHETETPGLVAHRSPENYHRWRVTHQASGLCVGTGWTSLRGARVFAGVLREREDWLKSIGELRRNAFLERSIVVAEIEAVHLGARRY